MPAITVITNGQTDTDMKEFVRQKLGMASAPSNTQVTAYWRDRIATEIKTFLKNQAELAAAAAITDPDIT